MIDHTDIPFHDSNLAEIKRVLDRLAPHEHPDGRNECAICDQGLDEAILVELRDSLALRGIIREALRLLSGSDGAGGWHEARRVLEQARVTGSRNSQEGEITQGSLPPHQIAHKATAQAEARGEFNGYPDRDAARRYYESGYLRCLLRLLLTDPTERGVWWCNTHERQAAGPAGCDPKLAGITMPCRVVYAAIDIKSEEEEAKEGLPESQQDGDKGQAMDSAIGDLESADQEVDDIILSVEQGVRYLAAAREP